MIAYTLLGLVIYSQVALFAAGASLETACFPGATRCDDQKRVLSACGEDGAWARSVDCGALGSLCLDGRCVSLSNASRAAGEDCTSVGAFQCSKDCKTVEFCNTFNVWSTIQECPGDNLCFEEDGEYDCGSAEKSSCRQDTGVCGDDGRYPLLGDCTSFVDCDNNLLVQSECPEGEQFHACYGSCVKSYTASASICENLHPKCKESDTYAAFAVATNPSLYYTCFNGVPTWRKCSAGFYVPQFGGCFVSDPICKPPAPTEAPSK